MQTLRDIFQRPLKNTKNPFNFVTRSLLVRRHTDWPISGLVAKLNALFVFFRGLRRFRKRILRDFLSACGPRNCLQNPARAFTPIPCY